VLADGAVIPEPRTAVPVEWDQVEKELNTLATSLGPRGGSAGALNKVLNASAANLGGQGQNMHDTLTALTKASTTLSDDRGDLFATVRDLRQFISVLAQANGQVGTFEERLDTVSGVLAGNKQELAAALAALNSSLGTVTDFVHGNRDALSANLTSLNGVVGNLAGSDQTLADILQVAPTQVANFNNIYNPVDHAINSELSISNFSGPAEFICATIFSGGGTPAQCQRALGPLVQVAKQDSPPVTVDPVNRDGYGGQGSPSAGAKAGAKGGTSGSGSTSGSGGLANLLLGGLGS
jgi:phospholipid/cholesterol/gamma-HCH transport system substrate-binding protein